MSHIGERDMPVIEAWPLDGPFSGHFAAAFPDGERIYPSAFATARAAARIGSSVRFRASRSGVHSEVLPPALHAGRPTEVRKHLPDGRLGRMSSGEDDRQGSPAER